MAGAFEAAGVAAGAEESAAGVDFLDLDDLFAVEAELSPAGAAEESVAAVLDFEDFLVEEAALSPAAEESEAAVLDVEDFLVVEVPVVESSVVVFFFFLAFAVASLWSVD